MSGFIQGQDRHQAILFPERLDDYISEDNPVRAVDVFIDGIDLGELGFKTVAKATGRPGYHPATLLKLYVYGYLNQIPSSRRLERESQRNVELMWLTGRLAPDFKTIADFRKHNGEAIQQVCRRFVLLCRKLGLLREAFVAIDGSKFKAVNNRDRNFTQAKLKRRLQQIDERISRYLNAMVSADRQEAAVRILRRGRLEEKLAGLRKEVIRLKKLEVRLHQAPDRQVSLSDVDARSMATSGRGTGMVGYNVQSAVDTQHHLIVAHEVTNTGHDRKHLTRMAVRAKAALGVDKLAVVADRGYFNSEELLACTRSGITTYLPKPQTSGNHAKGFFEKRDFVYKPQDDEYECPAGERLIYRFRRQEAALMIRYYWTSACPRCTIKAKCTTGDYRRVRRWEHEVVLEAAERRLDERPECMRVRRSSVEHPFATLKLWMGHNHFLTRTLPRVSTEMSLHVLAYNLKRVMALIGVSALIKAIRA